MTISRQCQSDIAIALILVVVGLAFRLISIGQESFTVDESVTLNSIDSQTWSHVREIETSPPLYFVLIKVWASVFGTSHESLRLFSALAGALAVGIVYVTGRLSRISVEGSALAALLLAVSPMAIWHSQQARMYGLVAFFSAIYLLSLVYAYRQKSWWCWLLVTLAIFLGFSTHYYFAFLIVGAAPGILLSSFLRRRNVDWFSIGAHLAGAALCLFYLPLFRYQRSLDHTSYIQNPSWKELLESYTIQAFVGPYQESPDWLFYLLSVIVIGIGSVGLVMTIGSSRKGIWKLDWVIGTIYAGTAFITILIPFFYSLHGESIFIKERYTVIALPAFLLMMAYILDMVRQSGVRRTALCLVALVLCAIGIRYDLKYYRNFQDFDWRGAAQIIDKEWEEGDHLLFLPGWLFEPYRRNGGTHSSFAASPIDGQFPTNYHGLWLIGWEQNPNEEELGLYNSLKSAENATARLEFPHLKLYEISLKTESPSEGNRGTASNSGPSNE